MVLNNATKQRRYRENKKRRDPKYLQKERVRVGALYVPSAELTPEARDERNARARESAARQAAGTARPREVQGRKEPAPKGVCKFKADLEIRLQKYCCPGLPVVNGVKYTHCHLLFYVHLTLIIHLTQFLKLYFRWC